MFKQLRLSAWSTDIRNKVSVPLRVELWNGKCFDFSHDAPRVTILGSGPSQRGARGTGRGPCHQV